MKVLNIITGLNRGGAENFLIRFCNELDKSGHDVKIISLSEDISFDKEEINEKVTIIRVDFKRRPFKAIFQIRKEIREFDPDKIFSWMYHSNSIAFFGCFPFFLSKLSFNIRHSINEFAKETFLTKLSIVSNSIFSNLIHETIFNSRESLTQHKKIIFGFKSSRMIPNGFNIQESIVQQNRESILNNLGIFPSRMIIGNIGRYHPMKNQFSLLESFLKLDISDDEVTLIFVGKNIPNLKLDAINAGLTSLNDKQNILFFDETKDIAKFYSILDFIFVVSEYGEGFPNVLVEAMQYGVIPYSTDVGDSKYIINNDQLIPTCSRNDIYDALNKAIYSTQARSEIANINFNMIKNEYDIKQITRRFLK